MIDCVSERDPDERSLQDVFSAKCDTLVAVIIEHYCRRLACDRSHLDVSFCSDNLDLEKFQLYAERHAGRVKYTGIKRSSQLRCPTWRFLLVSESIENALDADRPYYGGTSRMLVRREWQEVLERQFPSGSTSCSICSLVKPHL